MMGRFLTATTVHGIPVAINIGMIETVLPDIYEPDGRVCTLVTFPSGYAGLRLDELFDDFMQRVNEE